jgi:signal transduction histidine kinase/CheY-like chemotaxis protein
MPDGEREHIYCTSLPYCEWYLVTIMPYGELDTSISGLNSDRTKFMVVCVCIIVAELLCVFIAYLKMSRKQIRETEAAREEAVRASKAKSDFLSNMSHDIRTPMNAIVGMTAIAASNIDNTAKVEDCLKKITLSSRHLLGLINDVLDMSTIENGKMTLNPELVSLRDVMDSIVKIVQPQIKTKHQAFDVFIKDIKFENVYCDSVRLNQVLLNFLSNAIKFTPDGGSISVTISQEDSPKSHDCVRTHIYVKDTGIGMTPDFIKIIFESFEREDNKRVKKTEGTGLGMAITKHIVDAMGGTIEVESEPDVGTQFHVTLDLEAAMIEEEEMILPEWHMLLVDDDKELCESAYAELNSIGLKTEYTYDGETAVEMVWDRHNKHDDYHIVLLDWQLPGIDGIETARRIRKKVGKDVPILLISAYDWSDFEEEAREAGVSGFISKPLFRSTLFYGLKPYAMPDSADLTDTVSEKKSFEGIRILVAEDNDLNWEIAEGLLEQIGIMTEHAEDGQACVDMFRRSPINYYDAILMDIRMPVKNGYEATNEIRFLHRSDSELPIIAMTADAFSEDIKKCLENGMNAHIAKPISIAEVEKQLSRFL